MPSNLLLVLALLGGYLFIHLWHLTYFRAQALDGQRLLFEAAVAGFCLCGACRLLVFLLSMAISSPDPREWWYRLAGREPYLSTLILTLLCAPLLALLANLVSGLLEIRDRPKDSRPPLRWPSLRALSRERALRRAVEKFRMSSALPLRSDSRRKAVHLQPFSA